MSKRSLSVNNNNATPPTSSSAPNSKKRKSPANTESNPPTKKLFQRLWSKDDEVHLLQGLLTYIQQKGEYPFPNFLDDFHFFVKDFLSVDVNDTQISGKIKKLKSKFKKNAAKFDTVSDPHDKKMFDLSHKLWGADANTNKSIKTAANKAKGMAKGKKSKNGDLGDLADAAADVSLVEAERNVNVNASGGVAGLKLVSDEEIVKKAMELLSGQKKVELENKWKEFKVRELQLFMSKLEILKEPTEIVLNAVMEGRAN